MKSFTYLHKQMNLCFLELCLPLLAAPFESPVPPVMIST